MSAQPTIAGAGQFLSLARVYVLGFSPTLNQILCHIAFQWGDWVDTIFLQFPSEIGPAVHGMQKEKEPYGRYKPERRHRKQDCKIHVGTNTHTQHRNESKLMLPQTLSPVFHLQPASMLHYIWLQTRVIHIVLPRAP